MTLTEIAEMTERAIDMGKAWFDPHKILILSILTKFYRRFKFIIVCFIQKTQNIVQK